MDAQTVRALDALKLARPPVAVAFLSTPPDGVTRVDRPAAAGCSYWKHASDGHAFYTTAEDHCRCPVGAYTHAVDLPPTVANELQGLVGTMIQLQYLSADDVSHLPRRRDPLKIAAFAPLADASFSPDLVIFRGNAQQIMLLAEAARAAGAFAAGVAMGRPACAAVPEVINGGTGVASLGCVGNRVYTELTDDELYLMLPGGAVADTLSRLQTVTAANVELERFHRSRAAS